MTNEPGVDGYGPTQYDGFHWQHFIGALLTLALAGLLLYLSMVEEGVRLWLLLAAVALVLPVVVAARVSSFWRRYHYLVWWKQTIIFFSSLIEGTIVFSLLSLTMFIRRLPDGRYAGLRSTDRLGIDADGNVYRWRAFRGRWEPLPVDERQSETMFAFESLLRIERGLPPSPGNIQTVVPPFKPPR